MKRVNWVDGRSNANISNRVEVNGTFKDTIRRGRTPVGIWYKRKRIIT